MHCVNINLSDRKSKYGICHTSSSLSAVFPLRRGQEDGRGGGLGGIKERKVAIDCGFKSGKGQRTVGFVQNTKMFNSLVAWFGTMCRMQR